ncbi:MAG: hypothetical protein U0835_07485 [Isosphaeraceae bacterium]
MTTLIRLTGLLTLSASAVAVGLARVCPAPEEFRVPTAPRYYGVNGAFFLPPLPGSYVLDAKTGELTASRLEGGKAEFVACSPWADEHGRQELLGRLITRAGVDGADVPEGSWLIRYRPDDFSELGRFDIGPAVSGRPCWTPGRASRVLVPAGDGQLYVLDLDAEFEEPRPLVWDCKPPGAGRPLLSDPIASARPGLGERLIVSLSERPQSAQGKAYSAPRLWWLELDRSGRSIVAAGPLDREFDSDPSAEERLPSLSVTPSGRLVVAYFRRREGERTWRLMIAPLNRDEARRPATSLGRSRELARDLALVLPAFSLDGRWLYAMPRSAVGGPVVRRFEADRILDEGPAPGPGRKASPGGLARVSHTVPHAGDF